jgi:hypothetical protein
MDILPKIIIHEDKEVSTSPLVVAAVDASIDLVREIRQVPERMRTLGGRVLKVATAIQPTIH